MTFRTQTATNIAINVRVSLRKGNVFENFKHLNDKHIDDWKYWTLLRIKKRCVNCLAIILKHWAVIVKASLVFALIKSGVSVLSGRMVKQNHSILRSQIIISSNYSGWAPSWKRQRAFRYIGWF